MRLWRISESNHIVTGHIVTSYEITEADKEISETAAKRVKQALLMDSTTENFENFRLSYPYAFLKRAMDLIVSFIGLAVLSPLIIYLSVSIKREDKGDVFYRQERITKNGRIFRIIKFRSMRADAEADGEERLTQENDERCTQMGKMMRDRHWDEIPQLINVIRGEMSIVGPRPERPGFVGKIKEELPEFALREKVKAGLTGYAQIYGSYYSTPAEKLEMDLKYLKTASLSTDIRISKETLKIFFCS